ncbi:MAG TPA: RNA polymerase sigma factor [Acidimicrobiales bacterium]|nr:RNA polymerase sigma factor [Acidimicrobiales bacterium]
MDPFAGIPDSTLWARAAGHDGAAFGELFERHGTAVYNHCFRRTASWATAEELTSIVFAEAWRRRKDAQLYSHSILPWLLGVANNAIRHAHRSQRRHQRLLTKLPPPPVASDFGDDAARRLDAERAMARVLVELGDLRIEDREVIALCDWAGLSPSEAAAALDVPAGTVRSRLSRAHAQLRARLGEEPVQAAPTSTSPFPAREEGHGRA